MKLGNADMEFGNKEQLGSLETNLESEASTFSHGLFVSGMLSFYAPVHFLPLSRLAFPAFLLNSCCEGGHEFP